MIVDFEAYAAACRAAGIRRKEILRAYKAEITDWCHFDLAVELAAQKTGATEREVRAIACDPGVWS